MNKYNIRGSDTCSIKWSNLVLRIITFLLTFRIVNKSIHESFITRGGF